MKFNVNNNVKVKLTPLGHELMQRNHDEFFKDYPNPPTRYMSPPDENGWHTFQLWALMSEFGRHMRIGFGEVPFETEIEIIEGQ